jgi:predicted transposase/invertase (TIGR01784 family)
MERLPDELNNQLFQKLKSIVEIERMSANERLEYELSLAVERDLLSAIDASFEDGREEKGREIARNLKSLGLSLEDISKATGLTTEEIKQL